VLYIVLDFLFALRLCAFIRLFPYYSSIQFISCKCVFIKYSKSPCSQCRRTLATRRPCG